MFSPNGRWLAYVSDETGPTEVYVQRHPGPGRTMRIYINGDVEIVNCLFYDDDTAFDGGAVYNASGAGNSSSLINCTLVENDANDGLGGGVYNASGSLTLPPAT